MHVLTLYRQSTNIFFMGIKYHQLIYILLRIVDNLNVIFTIMLISD